MNKKIKAFALVAAVAAIGGYGVYTNQQKDVMSDLVLANVEALAMIEDLPEVEIICDRKPGRCWIKDYDLCMKGEYTGYRCMRTDNPVFYCTTPC